MTKTTIEENKKDTLLPLLADTNKKGAETPQTRLQIEIASAMYLVSANSILISRALYACVMVRRSRETLITARVSVYGRDFSLPHFPSDSMALSRRSYLVTSLSQLRGARVVQRDNTKMFADKKIKRGIITSVCVTLILFIVGL
mmetsp:Transcript_58973/g.70972  ORF Transcript_58973/g.70972 Transcript_58973/m.70972 type:complete len:144 (-) Transcript_58973:961-1392(-)